MRWSRITFRATWRPPSAVDGRFHAFSSRFVALDAQFQRQCVEREIDVAQEEHERGDQRGQAEDEKRAQQDRQFQLQEHAEEQQITSSAASSALVAISAMADCSSWARRQRMSSCCL